MFDKTGLVGEQEWFYHWIIEREKCRVGNQGKLPKPWSTDKILQAYRFCNVRREDDKVTKWIKDNWRDPFDDNRNMVFAMCVARLFNRVETLELIGFPDIPPHGFEHWLDRIRANVKERRANGDKIWTGAYLVSTNGHSMDKIDYVLDRVLTPIFYNLRPVATNDTLQTYHHALTQYDGMGSFMAGQVIADLKYTSCLKNATDWWSWAPIGPGSKRGLNRYFGRNLETSIRPGLVLEELRRIQDDVVRIVGITLPVHDVQNCCCEFDKYVRVKNCEGKPRSLYNGNR